MVASPQDGSKKDQPRYSIGEEIGNAITHGVGVLLALAALVVMVIISARNGDVWDIVSSSIFGVTMVLLYLASTMYHSLTHFKAKKVFRILDHSAIYLLIAGTYTPFCLITLHGPLGWTILVIVWSLAAAGIVFKSIFIGKLEIISTLVYIAMGWLIVLFAGRIYETLPLNAIILLVLGGISYTAGASFLAMKKIPMYHMIFHFFVLAGSALHFMCILLYVLP